MHGTSTIVTIANYNGAAFLERTVRSVLVQDRPDLTVVVVDNASSDDSCDVVAGIADRRLRLDRYDEHVSVTDNWNRCIATLASSGARYGSLLHSDDAWRPTFVSEAVAAIEATGAEAAIGNAVIIDELDREIDRATFRRRRRRTQRLLDERDRNRLLQGMDIYPCSWLARCDALTDMRFDPRFTRAPDWEFWLRMLERSGSVVTAPRAISCYRLHGSNDTFNTATLRGMRDEERTIVDEAIARRAPRPRLARRARRMVEVRCLIRCGQVLGRGDRQLAIALLRELRQSIGVASLVRAALLLARLPDTRAAANDALANLRLRRG